MLALTFVVRGLASLSLQQARATALIVLMTASCWTEMQRGTTTSPPIPQSQRTREPDGAGTDTGAGDSDPAAIESSQSESAGAGTLVEAPQNDVAGPSSKQGQFQAFERLGSTLSGSESLARIKTIDFDGSLPLAETRAESPTDSQSGESTNPPATTFGARVVPVFYGTDRAPTGQRHPEPVYGSDRRPETLAGILDYGVCMVSIPPGHRIGDHERPWWWSWVPVLGNEDFEDHIVILSVETMDRARFFPALNQELDKSGHREAFVFVHGFNVTFEDAVRRTGQLAYDLGVDGAPILYSWPSKGGLASYLADNGEISWTVPHLRDFLAAVAQDLKAKKIHLIAHSLGNRTLREAVAVLTASPPSGRKLLSDIVLAAPDVDAEEFARDYAPVLLKAASHVTLYSSDKDLALLASRKLFTHPRIGEAVRFIEGVDTIDASEVSEGGVNHSYLLESPAVLLDIAVMLRSGTRPASRTGLLEVTRGSQIWWQLKPIGR